ncbi:hypothetical protein HMPREF1624_03963 [Sporothrix schenckii ATCC 58251]|uniref:Xylanolytic transcriptional activator regulatory domain-containing protein n=2 Tax=Sporothrix schenckii TaxID=29908 RepID=U7PT03_SPOS1|nr:hypothetical protein HMPREF1624_03963 [Sporothrix schenckii ATCC 58251]
MSPSEKEDRVDARHTSKQGYEPLCSREDASAISIDAGLSAELVDLYFRYIHVASHNVFHRPSFTAAVQNGTIPKILFFGAAALCARFSTHASLADIDPRTRGRPYAQETERLLDLHDSSLTTIQACMLLGHISAVEGEPATESVFFSIACRMALILDLPNAAAATPLQRELNLRVWWSIVATDTWSSSALNIQRAISPQGDDTTIPMPMDERTFIGLQPDDEYEDTDEDQNGAVRSLSQPTSKTLQRPHFPKHSLIAQMIKLNQVLYRITCMNADVAAGRMQAVALEPTISSLSVCLDDWSGSLPPDMRNTPANLAYWAKLGFGRIFVILHLNYNYAAQLLFYQFLHWNQDADADGVDAYSSPSTTTAPPIAFASLYAQKCTSHAAALCALVYNARRHPDTDVSYSLVGHMLVIASTVQIYTLLFSADEDAIAAARDRLERNFEIITTLRQYWPCVDASLGRLRAFQNACLRCKEQSFQLDRWMLRFVLDYGQAIQNREEMDVTDEEGGIFHAGDLKI